MIFVENTILKMWFFLKNWLLKCDFFLWKIRFWIGHFCEKLASENAILFKNVILIMWILLKEWGFEIDIFKKLASKMWFLRKIQFLKCNFWENLASENVILIMWILLKECEFEHVNFGFKCGFLPQRALRFFWKNIYF